MLLGEVLLISAVFVMTIPIEVLLGRMPSVKVLLPKMLLVKALLAKVLPIRILPEVLRLE